MTETTAPTQDKNMTIDTAARIAATLRALEASASKALLLEDEISRLSNDLHDLCADDSVSEADYEVLEEVSDPLQGLDAALREIRNRAHAAQDLPYLNPTTPGHPMNDARIIIVPGRRGYGLVARPPNSPDRRGYGPLSCGLLALDGPGYRRVSTQAEVEALAATLRSEPWNATLWSKPS